MAQSLLSNLGMSRTCYRARAAVAPAANPKPGLRINHHVLVPARGSQLFSSAYQVEKQHSMIRQDEAQAMLVLRKDSGTVDRGGGQGRYVMPDTEFSTRQPKAGNDEGTSTSTT